MLRPFHARLVLTSWLLALVNGCSHSSDGLSLQCGPGTSESDGYCLPTLTAGGPGGAGESGAGGGGGEGPGGADSAGGEAGAPTGVCGEGTVLLDGVCVLDPSAAGSGGAAGGAGASGAGAANTAGTCPEGGSGPVGTAGTGDDPFGGGGSNAFGTGGSGGNPPCPCDSSTTDCDGDGWMVKDGDCCDQPGPCGQTPALQNPGAVEYQGDGVDNDCDGFFDEGEKTCDAGLKSSANDAFDYLRALDLCQFTKENVPLAQRKWGVISAEFTTAGSDGLPSPKQRAIRPKFGDVLTPLRGQSLLVLSSGVAADVNDTAMTPPAWELGTSFSNVSNSLGTFSSFPTDWLQANNYKLPTGCSGSGSSDTDANDSIMLRVRMRVPTNAKSFSMQGLFLSAEFPEFICNSYNDIFLVLVKNEAGQPEAPNPPDGNVAFLRTGSGVDVKKFPISINIAGDATAQKLFAACDPDKIACSTSPVPIECALGPNTLQGTGYDRLASLGGDCTIGGGTDWLTVAGNVVPGGIVELRILISDVGDSAFDSTVLLDSFVWNATPGTPGGNN